MTSIQRLLQKARDLREQGKQLPALNTCNEIIIAAGKRHAYAEVIEALGDRAIAFRHLFESGGEVTYAILARQDAEAMLQLVKQFGVEEKLHTAYYLLGQAALLFREYKDAENYFYKALKYFKGSKAEKASWKYHWGKALYLIGQKKKGILAFAAAINEIKKHAPRTDRFLTNVYLSGACANFAHVLMNDNPAEALRYLSEAEAIVRADRRLVIRRRQLDQLKKLFVQAQIA